MVHRKPLRKRCCDAQNLLGRCLTVALPTQGYGICSAVNAAAIAAAIAAAVIGAAAAASDTAAAAEGL
jgi:NhaP-type Na+/H+ or K+/H+ antiporter